MNHCYEYPRAGNTVDIVLFYTPFYNLIGPKRRNLFEVLLITRKNEPYRHHKCLPGGYLDLEETLKDSAIRELREETGIEVENLFQIKTYDAVRRDPRGRTITTSFVGVTTEKLEPKAGDDAATVNWVKLDEIGKLGFDHNQIVDDAFAKLLYP